jgi:hypothetical protein
MQELSPERVKLSETIAAHKEALADTARADELLRGANRMLVELLTRRDDSLDSEISAARAAQTVRAIESGERHLLTQGVQGYASRLTARDRVESELASIRETIPILESRLDETKRHVDDCAQAVGLAVEAVVIAEAEERARSFIRQIREAREALYVLRFLAARQVKRPLSEIKNTPMVAYGSSPTRAIKMPGFVIAACHENIIGDSEVMNGTRLRDAVSAEVSAYWSRLHSDPEAQMQKVEASKPFDKVAYAEKLKQALANTPREVEEVETATDAAE